MERPLNIGHEICFLQQVYTFTQDMLYERHNSWFVYVLTHVWKTISLFWKINTFQYGYPGVNSSQYLNEFLV